MLLPQRLARFNRVVTNPVQRLWAGRLPPLAIVEHTGRTTGRRYRTPVMAWRRGNAFAIVLTYGPDRDWLKNLVAANGGTVVRAGRSYAVVEPHVLQGEEALDLLPGPVAQLMSSLGIDAVVHLRTTD